MGKLKEKYTLLDSELDQAKIKLTNQLIPIIQEFMSSTGMTVYSIIPDYTETTTVGSPHKEFILSNLSIRT